jgi:hypothetical protein
MLLDIASYARPGPGRRGHLPLAQISRTVRRVPEAVVKVLPKGANDLGAVKRHLDYIGRDGELELETDEGGHLKGGGSGKQLTDDWDLDLDEHRCQAELAAARGRPPPRFVHKLIFSMPPGTRAQGVLAAARNFLREAFALKHRYAFVLHTDEAHPHVHAVVKAVSEQGVRLHIKKATLRYWRQEFARHLREQGIEANATERAVRGQPRGHKLDGIFRAHRRGASTHMRKRTEEVLSEALGGRAHTDLGMSKLVDTRREVERGWRAVGEILMKSGQPELAAHVRQFVDAMTPARTDQEWIRQREGPVRGPRIR